MPGRKGGGEIKTAQKRAAQVSIKVNERVCRNTKREGAIQVRRDREDVRLGEAQSEQHREVRVRNSTLDRRDRRQLRMEPLTHGAIIKANDRPEVFSVTLHKL